MYCIVWHYQSSTNLVGYLMRRITSMNKQIIIFTLFFTSLFILAACSSSEDELTVIQADLTENVQEKLDHIRKETLTYQDDFAENPNDAVDNMDEFSDEFIDYLQSEVTNDLAEIEAYFDQYGEPVTEEGKAYFNAYQATINAYILLLEENNTFLIHLLEDHLTNEEIEAYDQNMAKHDENINQQLEKLEALTEVYSEKYGIDFIDPLY